MSEDHLDRIINKGMEELSKDQGLVGKRMYAMFITLRERLHKDMTDAEKIRVFNEVLGAGIADMEKIDPTLFKKASRRLP